MLMEARAPIAIYALRDPAVTHGKDKALECCANKNLRARSLLIECLGENEDLNGLVLASERLRPLGRSPTAYFLYNYACRSVSPSSTFVLL